MSATGTTLRRRLGLWAALLFTLATAAVAQRPPPQRDAYAELTMHARLNEWRLSEDLAPLRRNGTLDSLAYLQAVYVSTQRPYPDGLAIHRGRLGEGVKERARWDSYSWPTYGMAVQIAVEEIAAIRTLDSAINFWKSSSVHRRAATNPTYREVGIAALPLSLNRYIYVVVLGARPGVLPALHDPTTGMLRMTRESYPYGSLHPSLKNPTEYRLFDGGGQPMLDGAWQAWDEAVPVPDGASGKLYVLLTDGTYEALSEVDLRDDVAWIPTLVPTTTPTPLPTLTLTPSRTPTPRITATPTITPTPTPIPGPELLLIYDDEAITLINVERFDVDMTGLEMVGVDDTLPIWYWPDIRFYDFDPGSCIQAYSAAVSQPPSRPRECRLMRAQRGRLLPAQRFWLEGAFEVRQGGDVIAECEPDAGRCVVDLPGQP